jgi:hypothetical protein
MSASRPPQSIHAERWHCDPRLASVEDSHLLKFVRFAAKGCAIWLDGDLPGAHNF